MPAPRSKPGPNDPWALRSQRPRYPVLAAGGARRRGRAPGGRGRAERSGDARLAGSSGGARGAPGPPPGTASGRTARLLPRAHTLGNRAATGDSAGDREDTSPPRVRKAPRRARTHERLGPMTAHDWYVENRTAFATRTLDRKEEDLFRNHLSRCEECRAGVTEVENALAWLPMGVAPVAPRPGLSRRLLDGVFIKRRSPWPGWAVPLAAVASLFLVAWIWTGVRREITALTDTLAAREARLFAL